MSLFRTQAGDVRPGWIAAVFALWVTLISVGWSLLETVLPVSFETSTQADPALALITLGNLVSALGATVICRRLFRVPATPPGPRARVDLLMGFTAASALISLSVLLSAASGQTAIALTSAPVFSIARQALQQFVVIGLTSVGEEFMIRGLAFQVLVRAWPPWLVIGLSASAFGAMHLFNPNSTWLAAACIVAVGVWFGLMAFRTGSLAMSIGAHLGWNFCEGFIWGQPVSGIAPEGALVKASWSPTVSFFSGGDFGPESSGLTVVLLTLASVVTWWWLRRSAPARP